MTTYTLFIYHIKTYESKNFSKFEAKLSVGLSNLLNVLSLKLWEIDAPQTAWDLVCVLVKTHSNCFKSLAKVKQIIWHEGDELHKTFDHDELLIGFQFLGDMINRVFFLLLVLAEIIAFSTTILMTIRAEYSDTAKLAKLIQLEHGK